jgi:PPOX class probable F420-dependent enzyme
MDIAEMRRRFEAARVARLATVRDDGRPHLVPVCFAVDGDVIVSVVDDKPKRRAELQRLDNVRAKPAVSLLVDQYDDDDWTQLWWVRADGFASVLEAGSEHARAVDLLVAKYVQYQQRRPAGAALVVAVEAWRGWSAS